MKIDLTEDILNESYKLDIEIVYSIEYDDGEEFNGFPPHSVFESLGDAIVDEIESNKSRICKGQKFHDFEISYNSFNDRDSILTFNVQFSDKIIGKYFVEQIRRVLTGFEAEVSYDNKVVIVVLKSVEGMLRYIG